MATWTFQDQGACSSKFQCNIRMWFTQVQYPEKHLETNTYFCNKIHYLSLCQFETLIPLIFALHFEVKKKKNMVNRPQLCKMQVAHDRAQDLTTVLQTKV